MNMSMTEAMVVLALVVAVCALIYTLMATRALMLRQNDLDARFSNLPKSSEVTDIRIKLASLEGQQGAVLAEAHGARAAIRRVEDFLLKSSKNHDS